MQESAATIRRQEDADLASTNLLVGHHACFLLATVEDNAAREGLVFSSFLALPGFSSQKTLGPTGRYRQN